MLNIWKRKNYLNSFQKWIDSAQICPIKFQQFDMQKLLIQLGYLVLGHFKEPEKHTAILSSFENYHLEEWHVEQNKNFNSHRGFIRNQWTCYWRRRIIALSIPFGCRVNISFLLFSLTILKVFLSRCSFVLSLDRFERFFWGFEFKV